MQTVNQAQIRQLGASLLVGESIAAEAREAFLNAIMEGVDFYRPVYEIVESLKKIAAEYTPRLATTFWESDVAAWLGAYRFGASELPKWSLNYIRESTMGAGRYIPPLALLTGDQPPPIIFPKLENAAKSLMARGILQRPVFDELSDQAKAKAFTVAGEITDGTIARIRDTLATMTVEGPSLPKFRKVLDKKLKTSLLGPGHIETVYRTNLQAAYRDGRESLVQDPIVGSIFPYQEYIPITDGRVRPEHLALGKLGLNGTGVYRRDDPFWDNFTPPWGYNCRCGTNLLTIRSAARKGVKEAQQWLKTGAPPENPTWRVQDIPVPSYPGFGQRGGDLVT